MEFFKLVDVATSQEEIQETLALNRMPEVCGLICKVQEKGEDRGDMSCLWGYYPVHRQNINGGVRFTLPTCPNAMAFTITTGYPPAPGQVVIHLTMSRTEHDPDFVETVEEFLDAWGEGLRRALSGEPAARPGGEPAAKAEPQQVLGILEAPSPRK